MMSGHNELLKVTITNETKNKNDIGKYYHANSTAYVAMYSSALRKEYSDFNNTPNHAHKLWA